MRPHERGAPHPVSGGRILAAPGADPKKALWLARMNVEVRKTARADDLLSRTISAKETSTTARDNDHDL